MYYSHNESFQPSSAFWGLALLVQRMLFTLSLAVSRDEYLELKGSCKREEIEIDEGCLQLKRKYQ